MKGFSGYWPELESDKDKAKDGKGGKDGKAVKDGKGVKDNKLDASIEPST